LPYDESYFLIENLVVDEEVGNIWVGDDFGCVHHEEPVISDDECQRRLDSILDSGFVGIHSELDHYTEFPVKSPHRYRICGDNVTIPDFVIFETYSNSKKRAIIDTIKLVEKWLIRMQGIEQTNKKAAAIAEKYMREHEIG